MFGFFKFLTWLGQLVERCPVFAHMKHIAILLFTDGAIDPEGAILDGGDEVNEGCLLG